MNDETNAGRAERKGSNKTGACSCGRRGSPLRREDSAPPAPPRGAGGGAALTFVIPAFNAAGTIGETLRSITGQARGDWSCVVVDDGSRDGTADVARTLGDARIRVVSQANRGLAGARNAGLALVETPFVCFLDADDTVAPGFAEAMVRSLCGDTGLRGDAGDGTGRKPGAAAGDLVACAYRYVGPGLEDLGWVVPMGAQDLAFERFAEFNPLAVGAVVARTGVLRAATLPEMRGPFDETLRVHEDWDLWLRLTRVGCAWAPPVEEPLFNYRLRADSMSTDLALMWTTGLGVIRRSGAGGAALGQAMRNWTVRSLARVLVRGGGAGEPATSTGAHAWPPLACENDARLCFSMLAAIGGLRGTEAGLLAGSLRWAMGRQDLLGPAEAARRWPVHRAIIAATLAGQQGVGEVISRLDAGAGRWHAALRAAAELAEPGERVVVYGLGRNGAEALAAAAELGMDVLAADDHAAATAPSGVRRIRPDELSDAYVVIVTPEDREAIVNQLASRCVSRIVLPELAASVTPRRRGAGAIAGAIPSDVPARRASA